MRPNSICRYIRGYEVKEDRIGELGQYVASLLLLCLMSMDFMTRFFYFAFVLFGVLIIMQRLKFDIPLAVVPASVLAISMCLFSPSTRGWAMGMIRPFAYPLCVIVGYNLVTSESRKESEKKIVGIAIALAIGACCHYLLNMVFNWGKMTDRNTLDIWTKSVFSATGQSSLACLMIGIGVPIMFSEIKGRYKVITLAILISIAYYNLMLGGRTLFILLIVLVIINILAEWIRNRKSQVRFKIILLLLVATILVFCIIYFNLFGIVDAFYKSNFYVRFFAKNGGDNVTEDGRMAYKLLYLQKMFLYPFGGNELHKAVGNHYAHDIFLDTYSDSGIFALISIMIMVGYYAKRTIGFYLNSQFNYSIKKMLTNLMVTILVMFCMEPTIEASPWLFASFCVIYGATSKLNVIISENKRSENAYSRN